MMSTNPEELLKTLNNVLDTLSKSPDKGTSRRPYYNPTAAARVKEHIDNILQSGKPLHIPLENCTINTIKAQWYQGAEYLIDHIDKSYEDKLKLLVVESNRRRGMFVEPKPLQGILQGHFVQPWRKDFETYIDESEPDNPPFVRIGIPLSQEDIDYVHKRLEPLAKYFIYEVTPRKLQVLRYDRDRENTESLDGEPGEIITGGIDEPPVIADPAGEGTEQGGGGF